MTYERTKGRTSSRDTDVSEFDEFVAGIDERIRKEEQAIYTERTLAEAYSPKNIGELQNPDGAARVTGPCGDTVQLHLKIVDDTIVDSKFITDGCGASTACGSVITELVKGKTVAAASRIMDSDVLAVLGGLPKENVHCALLAVNTLHAALDEYKKKKQEEGRR